MANPSWMQLRTFQPVSLTSQQTRFCWHTCRRSCVAQAVGAVPLSGDGAAPMAVDGQADGRAPPRKLYVGTAALGHRRDDMEARAGSPSDRRPNTCFCSVDEFLTNGHYCARCTLIHPMGQ